MSMTRLEQKEASSRRILEAARIEFSERGYAGTKISDIAARANVAVGLVSQRFGSKEDLYKDVLSHICNQYVGIANDDDIACIFFGLIGRIRNGALENTDNFKFFVRHLSAQDAPEGSLEVARGLFDQTTLPEKMKNAMAEGLIVNGDPFEVFDMFIRTAIFLSKSYMDAGLILPNDTGYLRMLRPQHTMSISENRAVISMLARDFDCVCYVDAAENEVKSYRISEKFLDIIDQIDPALPTNRRLDIFFKKLIHPDDFKKFVEDVDRNKLVAALEANPVQQIYFRILKDGKVTHCVLKVVRDKDNENGFIFGMADREEEFSRNELAERRDEVMKLLALEYTGIYYVDFLTGKFELFSLSDRIKDDTGEMLKDAVSLSDAFEKFVTSSVHPDDRNRMMRALMTARERLAHAKSFNEVFRRNYGGTYLFTEMTVVKVNDIDEPATAVALGFAEKDAELRLSEKQEDAMRSGIRVLYQTTDAKQALNNLMRILVDYHESDCAYIFELNRDRTLIRMSYEAVCDGLDPVVDDEKYEPVSTRQMWFDAFDERGEFVVNDVEREIPHDTPEYAKFKVEEVDNFMCVPLVSDGEITGFIGVDNAGFACGDLMILRTVAALAACEILRRQQAGEEHTILNKIAGNFNSVYFADMENNYIKNYTISDEYRDRYERVRDYDKFVELAIENDIAEGDAEKFKIMTSPEYVMKQFKNNDSFTINFIDNSTDVDKNFELQYIKANEEGTKAVMCSRDNSEAVEHEKRIRQAQQEQLELLISERTTELQEKNRQLSRVSEDIIELLGNITEARDSESGEHIRRVKGFTQVLAEQVMRDMPKYGLTPRTVELMASASALHDVGKIKIPDAILLKPGRLTKEEFDTMKTHCEEGCEILRKAPADWSAEYLEMSMEICRYHHEKYDGKGYPVGLKGDEIPISAQIVSVADCFDALTTKRVYKDAYSPDIAYNMILNGECGSFSPQLLACFEKCYDSFVEMVGSVSSVYTNAQISGENKASLTGTKILFAEDNELSREICVDILEGEGASVTAVTNGMEAASVFASSVPGSFDAILMDIQMPVMDGIDATEKIRSLDAPYARTIPIIALTSSTNNSDVERCLRAGMNSFLSKPVTISALTKVLLECMRDQSDALLEQLTTAVKMANRDALTGVKNMTAYTDMVESLTESIKTEPDNVMFALVECDINNLKAVNDTMGHDTGDVYIKNACSIICGVFKHSPVYRVGGDEFVIILRNADYDNRDALMRELKDKVSAAESIREVRNGRASLAAGIAVFDPELDDGVSTVYRRADGSMYNKKRLMKAGKGW